MPPADIQAPAAALDLPPTVFIGGGNMASAIAAGLLRQGAQAERIRIIEPAASAADALRQRLGVHALPDAQSPAARAALAQARLIVWAVKPQVFAQAAAPVAQQLAASPTAAPLHRAVAAGIGTASLARWRGSDRIVRAMPNTPALIGQGMTGLYAGSAVTADERALAERAASATGQFLWVSREELLDAVTALSGSGPAYVFYFLEAMQQAGEQMGLPAADALRLAVATFSGASALAAQGGEPPATLRQRVTSPGGTTHAAITAMQASGVGPAFSAAMHAACQRARELGREFG